MTVLCLRVGLAVLVIAWTTAGSTSGFDEGRAFTKAFIDGAGPGWHTLDEPDFVNVNCSSDTWKWSGEELHCTGQPLGVLASRGSFTNFELIIEWRHIQLAGNSGLFVWAPAKSLKDLPSGKWPDGFEAQIEDHGCAAKYEQDTGKKADWFTTHGDVFSVGDAEMKPFPPATDNGRRSLPRKLLSKGFSEWNHYYLRCVNGEIRLWVNGEEVSGGSDCEPRSGHLCIESEGTPIDFRNLRIRELP